MTGVLAISFPYHVLVFGDCRVTWRASAPRLQDNLQKVYHFSPTGVIAFAGGVAAAKALFKHIRDQPKGQPLPPSPRDIALELSSWARETYGSLPKADQVEFEVLYAAADYSRVSLAAENMVFAENVIASMVAPKFQPEFNSDGAALGYAKSLPMADLVHTRDQLVYTATKPSGIQFQTAIVIGTLGERLARISGEPVGGLFTVAIADARGVTWHPYSYGKEVGLAIVGRRFVQFDNRVSPPKSFLLEGVWEFDTRRPTVEDLYVQAPDSRPPGDSDA